MVIAKLFFVCGYREYDIIVYSLLEAKENVNWQQVFAKLHWGHTSLILSKIKDKTQRECSDSLVIISLLWANSLD
jgi:hypothetical protein